MRPEAHLGYIEAVQARESELTEREPDPKKRTGICNAEAGRKGKAKGQEGEKTGRRERGGERSRHRSEAWEGARERQQEANKQEECNESSRLQPAPTNQSQAREAMSATRRAVVCARRQVGP